MTDTSFILGQAGTEALDLNLDRLIGSHACVIANSGGGKSGLLRKILEQTHGQVQHIVLDVEDEFYSLRERFDYVIAGGDDGDVPISLESAAGLAIMALEHGFSLIVQLNDLGVDAAEYVSRFLDALVNAPKHLWHPVLVTIDELQRFASKDAGEATPAIKDLMFRGRKRGFTGLFASLRMAEIDPGIRGMVNNWMLGRVGQALDRKTMAEQLGFSSAEARKKLAQMVERHFWAMGPALTVEPTLFKVADVETTPVHAGQAKIATPPAPEALREILAALAVAPAKAESSNSTGSLSETIRLSDYSSDDLIDELGRRNVDWPKSVEEFDELRDDRDGWKAKAEHYHGCIDAAVRALGYRDIEEIGREIDDQRFAAGLKPARPFGQSGGQTIQALADAGLIPAEPANAGGDHEVTREAPQGRPAGEARRPSSPTNVAIPPRWQRILDAIAWVQRLLKREAVERNIVAWFAEISPKSSSYSNDLGAMRTQGLIDYPGQGLLTLADAGKQLANWPDKAPTKRALVDAIKSRLEPRLQRIVETVFAYETDLARELLAEEIQVSATSSSFSNDLGKLRTLGLIDYPSPGRVGKGRVLQ